MEETALLLKVVFDYKVAKSAAGKDWERIRSKHDDLSKHFTEAYPNEQQTNFQEEKTKETFNAARVSSKLKKLKISFISVLFWNRSIWFCPFTLEPNGTVPNGNIPSAEPIESDSSFKWKGSKGSSVNGRPICTNFGTVPFGTVPFGSSVNGV